MESELGVVAFPFSGSLSKSLKPKERLVSISLEEVVAQVALTESYRGTAAFINRAYHRRGDNALVPETIKARCIRLGKEITSAYEVDACKVLEQCGIDPETGLIDYDQVRRLAEEHKPKMIIAGASAYPRIIDFKKFGEIAHDVGAYLMVDMAHIAGLVAAGEHPSPFPYADVVTTTTHKTMRGPRGGIILTNNEEIAAKIDKAMFPGTQGGPLMHIIAAKAVAMGEALRPEFKTYQAQIVKNAKALAETLKAGGVDLVSGGTDNHLMLLDLRKLNISGQELEDRLDRVHITVNKNAIPGDTRPVSETSGIRIGTPAVTTRGFDEEEMRIVGELILKAIFNFDISRGEILSKVDELCVKHPLY